MATRTRRHQTLTLARLTEPTRDAIVQLARAYDALLALHPRPSSHTAATTLPITDTKEDDTQVTLSLRLHC